MNPVSNVIVATSSDPYRMVEDWSAAHPGWLGFDVETDGQWSSNKHGAWPIGELRCSAFSDGRDSIVLAPDVDPGPLMAHDLVAHSASFDLLWISRAFGYDRVDLSRRVDDTYTMSRAIEPWRWYGTGHGLKVLGPEILGEHWSRTWDEIVERYGVDTDAPTGKRAKVAWASITFEDAGPYCADDAAQTALLRHHYIRESTVDDRNVLAFEREVDAAVAEIEDRGFLRSAERTSEFRKRLTDNRKMAIDVLHDEYGMEKPTDAEFRRLLERLEAPLITKTKTGQWKVDKNVRDALASREGPWQRPASLYRAVKDDNAWGERLARGDDTAHPAINPRGTVTWRWTVVGPPMHTFPKESKTLVDGTGIDMRSIWLAPPFKVLVGADYSAMEFVVCAGMSEDHGMLDAVGRQYEVLQDALGISRAQAKVFTLAGQYNQGFTSIAANLGLTKHEAQVIRAKVFGGFVCPEDCQDPDPMADDCRAHGVWRDGMFNLRRYRRSLLEDAVGRYHVWRSPTGRKFAFDQHHSVNYSVQGHSRDITMVALLRARKAGLDVWLAVHDELIVATGEGDAIEAAKTLEECMAETVGEATLVAKAKVIGRRWTATEVVTPPPRRRRIVRAQQA